LRHRQIERALDDQRNGSALDGGAGELVPVRLQARDTDEQRTGLNGARVVREVRDVDGSGVDRAQRPDGPAQQFELDEPILPSPFHILDGVRLRRKRRAEGYLFRQKVGD
jgi:hypothetical protein